MKKILTLLFLLSVAFCNAQNVNSFSSNDYKFTDDDKIISPLVDYANIFIVFNNEITESAMSDFEASFPELKEEKGHKLPWENKKHYLLDQSLSKNLALAEASLSNIRQNPTVKSAYPAFIWNGEIAYIDNCILLNIMKEDADAFMLADLIDKYNGTVVEEMDMIRSTTYVVEVPANINIFKVCNELYKKEEVVFAQPNFHFTGLVDFVPNDPMLTDQWFLNQSSDADIDAFEAWDITTGSSSVAVAVIDGHGFDLNHVEMIGKYLSPFNGVENNNDPSAVEFEEKHGTPCSGLIGALTNNSTGVASVGYNIKVVPIKMGYDFGSGGTFQTNNVILTRSCEHVMTSPYDIVAVSNSYTMGTWANTAALRAAYGNMRTDSRGGLGSVVLASTGNDNAINSVGYPCHYPNVVGVGATDRYDTRSSFSNYGDSTDIAAPGTETWTIDRTGTAGYSNNDYYEFSGTSAACPVAAGVVGLIASAFDNYTEGQLRSKLFTSCEKIGGYAYSNNSLYPFSTWSTQVGYGRVNAFQAVQGGGSSLNPPTNLAANVSGNNVHLTWTAPSGGGGGTEELIYDNNVATGSYKYPGFSMSTKMSPSGPCQVLTIKFYTTIGSGDNQFNANIFNWSGSQPGTTVLYTSTTTAQDGTWVSVDVSGSGVNVSGDFVVGFGSFTEEAYLGYDENLNNGRSWDLNESTQTWGAWTEAYLIRAIVEYPTGKIAVLGGKIPETMNFISEPEIHNDTKQPDQNIIDPISNQFNRLLGLLGYKVYRNGTALNSSPVSNVYYDDNGLAAGTYNYTVSAWYDEGESDPVGPVQAVIGGSTLEPPTDLQASVSGNTVNLSWTSPGSGSEEWIKYNDGTFESSFSSTDGGAGLAQLFTLSSYPALVSEVRFFTTNYESWDQPMTVYILSGDGTTILGGPYFTGGVNNNWINIATSVTISQSTFMVATYNDNADGPYVGVDDSFFNQSLYFGSHTNGFTELSQLGDYEYIGSHEAKVMYQDKNGNPAATWLRPGNQSNMKDLPVMHKEDKALSAEYPDDSRALNGFNIYRNGSKINGNTWTATSYADAGLSAGTYNYTVSAVYDEGESGAAGPVQAVVSGSTLIPPSNLQGSVSGSDVTLWWLGPGGGSQEELIYDNNTGTGGYTFPGATMSSHMSPSGACQILTLKYLTSLETGDNTFNARVFNWSGTEPGNSMLYEKAVTGIEGWVEVDVSAENLFVTSDFVVGFGSVNEQTYLAYDENLDNGRSWDRNDATEAWSSWNEAYVIRAVVQYGDGSISEIGGSSQTIILPKMEIDKLTLIKHGEGSIVEVADPIENQFANILGLLGYNLYRDDVKINSSTITTTYTNDNLPGWGTYNYNVKAVYDEGESANSNTFTTNYYFGVDELEEIDVRIYPNPAHGSLFINAGQKIKEIQIFTIGGRTVISEKISDFEHRLDISSLNPGLYIIQIETDNGRAAAKILVN